MREKGGAYGAGAYLDNCERIFTFYSYRDPRLDDTIKDFLASGTESGITAERLEDAVIGVLARDLKPMAPAVRSLVDIRRLLYRISDSERERIRKEILSLSVEDVQEGGRKLKEELDEGCWMAACIGDKKAVEASEFPWQAESLPL